MHESEERREFGIVRERHAGLAMEAEEGKRQAARKQTDKTDAGIDPFVLYLLHFPPTSTLGYQQGWGRGSGLTWSSSFLLYGGASPGGVTGSPMYACASETFIAIKFHHAETEVRVRTSRDVRCVAAWTREKQ